MRLFVGFQLSKDIISKIIHTQDFVQTSLTHKDVVRWISPNNLHVTAVFLGRVDDENVRAIKSAVEDIGKKYNGIEFTVKGFGLWPKGKYPRIAAYNLNHPAKYGQLQAELASKLAAHASNMGALKPAHLTIGRVSKKAKAKSIQQLTSKVEKTKLSFDKLKLASLQLFHSNLSSKGSTYKII